jgi:ADP-heptose:LPS heptosyltransferase
VGIAWQGNPAYQTDHRRSVPLSAWVPFLRQAQARGVAIYSLQKGHGSEQVAGLPAELGVHDLARGMDEGPGAGGAFVDTAAVIAGLDLVISSDTAIPHLGGALGTPTWMLLSHLPDWRWGHQGRACPWYPRLRLFRQPQAGDWGAVFEALCAALPEIERTHA